MLKTKHALLAALAVPALAVALVACSGDDKTESSSDASQQSIDELTARVQRNEQLFAIQELGALPLHATDDAINDTAEDVPTTAIPTMRSVARLVAVTNWNAGLKSDADSLRADALAVITALESDDRATAGEHAHNLHESAHDFIDKAWENLAPGAAPPAADEEAGDETPAAGATDDHGASETPAASETP